MHIGKRGLLLLVLLLLVLLLVVFVVVAELAYINRRPPPGKETSQRYTMARPQTRPPARVSATLTDPSGQV
jgi:ABC-type transporter Mla subunit MlaD